MKRKYRRIALAVVAVALFGAGILARWRSAASEPAGRGSFIQPTAPLEIQIDTPPPMKAAAGWPFQQLPMVAKFDFPVPRIIPPTLALVPIPPTPVERVPVPGAPVRSGQISPLWLLPIAAGAGIGGAEGTYSSVVPEPSTLLLLSTGLALLGARSKRRRRKPGG